MAALTMRVGHFKGPSLNPAVCWNIRASSPTPPQGEVTMGEVRTISRKPSCLLAARREERRRILRDCTPENRAETVHRPGLERQSCVKSLFDPSTRLSRARIQEPVRSPRRRGSLQTYVVAASDSPEARKRGRIESNCLR